MDVNRQGCPSPAPRCACGCLDTDCAKNKKYDANSLKPIKFYFFRIELYKYGHLYSLNQYFSVLVRINMAMNTD